MQTEKYLNEIKKIDMIIKNKLVDHRRFVELAEEVGGFSVGERVRLPRNLHRSADAIARYTDIEGEIAALKAKRQAIIDTLQKLPQTEYEVLYKLYVEGYTPRELPKMFGRSYEWVKKARARALRDLQKILDGDQNT